MKLKFTDPTSMLAGVGQRTEQLLEKLEIKTVGDLMMHIPSRYEEHDNIKKINEIDLSEQNPISVICSIEKIDNIFTRNGFKLTKARVKDDTGTIDIVWFNQHYLTKSLKIGTEIILHGKVDNKTAKTAKTAKTSKTTKSTKPEMKSPQWEYYKKTEKNTGLMPVYPASEGIPSKFIKNIIQKNLNNISIEEIIPQEIIETYKLIDLKDAYVFIHKPENYTQIYNAKLRLSFDELLFLHIKGIKTRKDWESKQKGHIIKITSEAEKKYLQLIPFELTKAQLRSIKEINKDLSSNIPMNRLLQGDVGSGKTVVAASAAYHTYLNNSSTIILAPTQILAKQHYEGFMKLFGKTEMQIELVTNESKSLPVEYGVIIGTHAILHRLKDFTNVALIIIDEQHRFGVGQRSKLVDHYSETIQTDLFTKDVVMPNLLTMTATPIPRSLALTYYGDLDLSIIDEMPKGRKLVQTWVIKENQRQNANEWIKNEIKERYNQVFIVCPFIEESKHDNLQGVKAAEIEFEKIKSEFREFKVGLLHGKMDNKEKDNTLKKFGNNEYQILVSTPVIEVGIDFPNANIILIETPERFGLASLHQLRGRVGRGDKQAYCILITENVSQTSYKRLKYMETVHNGNKLSEIDMKMRGPGNIYGTEQHGFMQLKIADITDIDMIKLTKSAALNLFENRSKYPQIDQYIKNLDYIGDD